MVSSLDYGFFWLYAGFLTVSVAFIFFVSFLMMSRVSRLTHTLLQFVPETRHVPLERMEEIFGGSAASTHVYPHDERSPRSSVVGKGDEETRVETTKA